MTFRILVLGSGGREHALAWRLALDPGVDVMVAPGNDRIAARFPCVPVDDTDAAAVTALAREWRADLVVVGPEAPLAAGVADALGTAGIPVFGPMREAARLESSKWFAKEILREAGVPSAAAEICTREADVPSALDRFGPPYVVKADGLAAGKGVLVTRDRAAALEFAAGYLGAGAPGARPVVIEAFLEGEEASVMAVCDGERCVLLPAARDYKRAYDGDRGPNTGGMGAVSPAPVVDARIEAEVEERIVLPVLRVMAARGTPYRGTLYCGLMLGAGGVRVVEFNCRFGDPEAQVILPRVQGAFGELLRSAARGALDPGCVTRAPGAAVAVALADAGYPEAVRGDGVITGLDTIDGKDGVTVFGAGLARADSEWRVRGGRAAYVMAHAAGCAEARHRVYAAIDALGGTGWRCRRDIAASAGDPTAAAGSGRPGMVMEAR